MRVVDDRQGEKILGGEEGKHSVQDSDCAEFKRLAFFGMLDTSAGLERGSRPPFQMLGAC